MALQKATKDIVLGGTGLNVKTDPQLQPDGMLTQAQDVYYTLDGSLTNGYADLVSTNVAEFRYPTLATVTKENTMLVAGRYGVVRNYDGALLDTSSSVNPFLSATTLRATQSQVTQLPLIQLGASGSIQFANARNVHSCSLSLNANFGANKILLAWDVINPNTSPVNGGIITYGIWDAGQSVWFLPPVTLNTSNNLIFKNGLGNRAQFGGIQPMCLPSGHIVYSAQTYDSNSFNVLQGVCVTLNANGTAGTFTTLDPNYTGTSTGSRITSGALQDMEQQPLNSTLAVFALGYSYAGPNVWLYTVAAGGVPNTLRGATLTTANTSTVTQLAITVDTPVVAPSSSRVLYVDTNAAVEVNQAGTTTRSGTGKAGALLVLSSDGVSNYYLGFRNTILSENALKGATAPLVTGTLAFASLGPSPIADNLVSNIFAYQLYDPALKAVRVVPAVWAVKKNTFVCYDLGTGNVIGRWAYLSADSSQTSLPQCVQAFTTSAAGTAGNMDSPGFVFVTDGATLNSTQATTGPVQTVLQQQLQFVSMTYGATYAAEVPYGSLTNGLAPMLVGPQTASEDGYSWTPSFTVATGTGTLTGSYSYAACWQWVDDFGNLMWGRPTFVGPINLASQGAAVAFSTRTPPSNKGQLYLFRTQAGQSTYYGIGPVGGSVTDTLSDANLINGNIILYTSATGELPNDPMPPCALVISNSQCALAASAELGYRIYVSKPFVAGHCPEWNFGMYVDVSPATGPITGLAVMDDKFIVFKQNTIFIMSGSSFDATGANASPSFTQPQQLATYYGCVSPKSVQVTDQGVFFQSPRGIEILGRDLVQNFIGQVLDGINMTIVDSCLVQSQGHVRFLDSAQLTIWVWDAVAQKWSSRSASAGTFNYQTPVISCVTGGNQKVYFSASRAYENVTLPLTSNVTTGWVKTAGLQGFARLYRFAVLGYAPVGTVVTVQVAYNYNDAVVDTFSFTSTTSGYVQFRDRVSVQRSESVRFTIAVAGVAGQAPPRLSGVSLEYGQKSGVYRLGLPQTTG